MLAVGREINIQRKKVQCRKCTWQGGAAELRTGLIRIAASDIYLYAYCCPACGSFAVKVKGKVLAFRAPGKLITHEIDTVNDNQQAIDAQRKE